MKNVLIIGRPFHMLENQLEFSKIRFDKAGFDDFSYLEINKYSDIVLIGLNVLLNPSNMDVLKDIFTKCSFNCNVYLWNHEPFWDYRLTDVEYLFGKKVFIYNCYNEKVHTSLFSHYFGVGGILWRSRVRAIELPEKDMLKEKFDRVKSSGKLVCAYATCFHVFMISDWTYLIRLFD